MADQVVSGKQIPVEKAVETVTGEAGSPLKASDSQAALTESIPEALTETSSEDVSVTITPETE